MERGQFDFEKLIVYQKSLEFYALVRSFRFSNSIEDGVIAKQLFRAALSISLNIAEGTGKTSLKDRRNYFAISRGSVFECAAIILAIERNPKLLRSTVNEAYDLAVELGKMLSALIVNIDVRLSRS